jgi:ADP-heptose:LPS heptosyltransferase
MGFKLKTEHATKILLRRQASLGDVIMLTGVVRELRRRYGPNTIIDVTTDALEVFRNNPNVRNVIPLASLSQTKENYDIYINLDNVYETNPSVNYADNYFFRAMGTTDLDKSVELFPTEEDRATVDADIANIGGDFIVVHMRRWNWEAKNINISVWFDVFAKVFEQRADFKIVTVGGNTDLTVEDHPLFVDLRGKYNAQQLKHLCDNAKCFVGIDSGPYHCAAASDTHIIALLTHLHPDIIMPYRHGQLGWNSTSIPTNESCRGCNERQAKPVQQIICEKTDYPCVRNFDTDVIADAIVRQL